MVEAAGAEVGFPSFTTPPLGVATREPIFELPKAGVTFLVGGLTAAVLEVAVKISATVSAGAEWPNYRNAEMGDVVWLSSRSRAEEILHRQFEAATAFLPGVRFLEAELDNFGLSIRNLSDDLLRLGHAIANERPVKLVVLDHFSEYLRFGDTGKIIRSFESAICALQEFAVKHGAAVVLPCQLTTRDERTVSEAVRAVQSLRLINAVYFIKRDVRPNRGTLVHLCPPSALMRQIGWV